jgi:hypothetical protein
MITTIMAAFAFGYCVVDIYMNYRSNQRINEFMKDFSQPNNYDD